MITNLIDFLNLHWKVQILSQDNENKLQEFLNLFDGFFLLCEGEKGNALDLLNACPSTKDISKDKNVLGIYEPNY